MSLPVAQRLQRIPPYPFREVAMLKKKLVAEGKHIYDFGIGDPDMPTPKFVIDALYQAAQDPTTHQYDESGYGIPEYKQAIADFAKTRFGVDVNPDEEIQSCIGSKEALAHIVWSYVDPGDVVLVPDPAYSVYKVQTMWCGGAAFPMPLDPQRGFLPDLEAIPLGARKQAKLMFLNYPNNPTGAVATREFLAEAVEFAHKWGLIICHDAAYCEVAYDGVEPASILEIDGAKEVAIEFHSFSKTFNMTGWRVGWAMGGKEIIDALSRTKSNVDSGTFMAIQRAGIAALSHYREWIPGLRAEYQKRRDALVEGLRSLGWPVEPPKATFYVWTPVPKGYNSIEFSKTLLEKTGVLTIAGSAYGDYGEGFVRWSLTIQAPDKLGTIQAAVEAIRQKLPLSW
ncbi:MAG: LL-diaminopimelate aminotransferase [Armatimonadetes bacterium]|nr:LL-diaminopimelate aminotransferase [Armatimonadota bacterium]